MSFDYISVSQAQIEALKKENIAIKKQDATLKQRVKLMEGRTKHLAKVKAALSSLAYMFQAFIPET